VRETLLFIHFIGLGLGLGTSFSMMTLGIVTKDMPPAEKIPFFLKAFALGRNGSIGFALLILSGVGLIFVNGPAATFVAGGGFFHAKLALVAALAGLLGYMQTVTAKVKRDKGGPAMAKLPLLGRIGLISTLIIVALAVLAFH
jgi:uncharacterized membrane protein